LGKASEKYLQTEQAIIIRFLPNYLKSDLNNSILLGNTKDGKKIYVCKKDTAPNILAKSDALREITFRKVGEGTGKVLDTRHL
jgi:hypothetical protein